jgi:hypothetical protein
VHVIGVLVGPLVVVGDEHLRLVALDERRDPAGGHLQRDVAEGLRAGLVLPLSHAGVLVAKGLQVAHAKDLDRLAQLGQPQLRHRLHVVALLAGLDAARSVAELAIGAGDHNRADALVAVLAEDAAAG